MKHITVYIAIIIAVLTASCGHSDSFRVEGRLADGKAINLRIIYYSDGAVVTGITASKDDGKFIFEGHLSSPALVEIYDNDYRLLGRMVASPGDDLEATLNTSQAYLSEVKGNKDSEEWSKFLNTNAEMLQSRQTDARNALIAKYVQEHPDSHVSELLMMTEYDASADGAAAMADSLLGVINPEIREKGYSVGYGLIVDRVGRQAAKEKVQPIPYRKTGNKTALFKPSEKPYSLLAFTNDRSGRDTVVPELRKLMNDMPRRRFNVVELSMDIDTVVWARSIRTDTAAWIQGWVAGAISGQSIDRLGLPDVPYYILADSTGHQIWRGKSLKEATTQLRNCLKR